MDISSIKHKPLSEFFTSNNLSDIKEDELDQQQFNDLFTSLSSKLKSSLNVELKSKTFFAQKDTTRKWFQSTIAKQTEEDDPESYINVPNLFIDIIYVVNMSQDSLELLRIFYTPANTRQTILTSPYFNSEYDEPQEKVLHGSYRPQLLKELIYLLDDESVYNSIRVLGEYGLKNKGGSEYDDVPFSGRTF